MLDFGNHGKSITPPNDLIKPTISFEPSEHDKKVLEFKPKVQIINSENDPFPTPDDFEDTMREVQKSLLFVKRVFCEILAAGNPPAYAHMSVQAIMSAGPELTQKAALDWVLPDMSSVTGETLDPLEDKEVSIGMANVIARATQMFDKTAITLPVLVQWAKIGAAIGLDHEDISIACSTILDLDYVFGPILCECDDCFSFREENQS